MLSGERRSASLRTATATLLNTFLGPLPALIETEKSARSTSSRLSKMPFKKSDCLRIIT